MHNIQYVGDFIGFDKNYICPRKELGKSFLNQKTQIEIGEQLGLEYRGIFQSSKIVH